jgi:hypothetical protein
VVITGLTKQKLGDTFAGLRNVTLATSNGLVYSWGQNLLPAPHHKRSQLQHLASAAAAAAKTALQPQQSGEGAEQAQAQAPTPISSVIACEENSTYCTSSMHLYAPPLYPMPDPSTLSTNYSERREQELGEVTQDLIALSLADSEREWSYYQGSAGTRIDWQAVSNIACK